MLNAERMTNDEYPARGLHFTIDWRSTVASAAQRAAARRNIKKAATAAKRKRTIAHLSKRTSTALGKQAAKVAKRKKR
jgi:hypothetical protein